MSWKWTRSDAVVWPLLLLLLPFHLSTIFSSIMGNGMNKVGNNNNNSNVIIILLFKKKYIYLWNLPQSHNTITYMLYEASPVNNEIIILLYTKKKNICEIYHKVIILIIIIWVITRHRRKKELLPQAMSAYLRKTNAW